MKLFLIIIISLSFPTSAFSYEKQIDSKIPFRLIKDLIVIPATADGKKGNFILDTGAKQTTLNAQYFKGYLNEEFVVRDVTGSGSGFHEKRVTIQLTNNNKNTINAIIANFGDIEKILNESILGYIGYDILKNHEVVFDFNQKEIGIYPLNKKGRRKNHQVEKPENFQTIKLKRNGHLPYLTLSFENKKLKFGMDSGASVNLIKKGLPKKLESNFQKQGFQRIAGFNGNEVLLERGILHNLNLFELHWLPMNCVSGKMLAVNNMLPYSLDGLLGIEFLKQYKMAINYKKNVLTIWYPERLVIKQATSK